MISLKIENVNVSWAVCSSPARHTAEHLFPAEKTRRTAPIEVNIGYNSIITDNKSHTRHRSSSSSSDWLLCLHAQNTVTDDTFVACSLYRQPRRYRRSISGWSSNFNRSTTRPKHYVVVVVVLLWTQSCPLFFLKRFHKSLRRNLQTNTFYSEGGSLS